MTSAMKADPHKPWAQTVDAVPTLVQFRRWQRKGVSLKEKRQGRLTIRDLRILQLVAECRILTARQIQIGAGFPLTEHDSRCQLRLTLLQDWGILATLPGRAVNEPAVYLLTKQCELGIRLLRQMIGEGRVSQFLTKFGSVDHLLGINDIRVRVIRACVDLGYKLGLWQTSKDLYPYNLQKPIPDGYFEIQRTVDGTIRTSAFFLEFEQSTKSSKIIRQKLQNYYRLVYGGRYSKLFEQKVYPRILVIFYPYLGLPTSNRVAEATRIAQTLGVRNARFIGLEKLCQTSPSDLLCSPVWVTPTEPQLSSLLPIASTNAS